jgi:hypothetical protein
VSTLEWIGKDKVINHHTRPIASLSVSIPIWTAQN